MNFISPICFIDPPAILNAYITSIPGSGSAPLQIVADTGARSAGAIDYMDTTGEFIGVYIGSVGLEVLLCIIGNGLAHRVTAAIPPHSRISLRSLTATAITNGEVTCSFMAI
jgi:hypothetical protein